MVEDAITDLPFPVGVVRLQKSRGQRAGRNHQKQGKYKGVSWEQGWNDNQGYKWQLYVEMSQSIWYLQE